MIISILLQFISARYSGQLQIGCILGGSDPKTMVNFVSAAKNQEKNELISAKAKIWQKKEIASRMPNGKYFKSRGFDAIHIFPPLLRIHDSIQTQIQIFHNSS